MDNCAAHDHFRNQTGCEEFFDGLVCWPFTVFDQQARVNCLEIKAFAQALKFVTNNEIGIYAYSDGELFNSKLKALFLL